MSELNKKYECTACKKKKMFDANDIIDMLIQEPYNVDINNLAYTPNSVIINMPREEYTKKNIGLAMNRTFENVGFKCKEDKLIILGSD